jgi:hypothetical protein
LVVIEAEIGALGQVLAAHAVGVVVGAALPGAVGIAEVDVHAKALGQIGAQSHLCALVVGALSREAYRGDRAAEAGLDLARGVEMTLEGQSILLGKPVQAVLIGWSEAAQRLAQSGACALAGGNSGIAAGQGQAAVW